MVSPIVDISMERASWGCSPERIIWIWPLPVRSICMESLEVVPDSVASMAIFSFMVMSKSASTLPLMVAEEAFIRAR